MWVGDDGGGKNNTDVGLDSGLVVFAARYIVLRATIRHSVMLELREFTLFVPMYHKHYCFSPMAKSGVACKNTSVE